MAWELLIPFALATLAFAASPGPGTIYCAAQSLSHGWRAGLRAAVGLHVGGYAHVIAAALGLAIVFETIPVLFSVMKVVGAALLIWMGIALIRARIAGAPSAPRDTGRGSFWKSVTVELLNPTTALFYLAFLPQFVSASAVWSVPVQLIVLGIVVNVVFSVPDVIYAIAGGSLRDRLAKSARLRAWMQRAGGAVLIGLGLNLALNRSA